MLDAAFENEAKCKSEAEASKRELSRLQDKMDQAEGELRHARLERDKFATDFGHKHKTVESDLDKLHLEIAQLTTERDQLVRQLEKSQEVRSGVTTYNKQVAIVTVGHRKNPVTALYVT